MSPLHDSISSLTELTRLMWMLSDDEYNKLHSIAKQQSELAKQMRQTDDHHEKRKLVQETLALNKHKDQLIKQYYQKYESRETIKMDVNYNFASVLVGLLYHHEYYYGDINAVKQIAEEANKRITNHRVECVNLWMFPSEDMMNEYINEKKAFYEGTDADVNFVKV